MKYCYKCHTEWKGVTQPGTRETCDKCNADLHICLNCRFYDEHKPYECQVNNIDPVKDKERANFCEEFQFADKSLNSEVKDEQVKNKKDKAKEQWNRLFKK